ncbi:MAG: TspO/MBR family protein [Candidatus Woesearchaeota archaeon]
MIKLNYWKLIASILICQLAGFIGSFFTITAINSWYSTLVKPSFNPPNWLFGPVWTLLYLLMGISLYLLWVKGFKTKQGKLALTFFVIQLVLNTLWSILFFGLQNPMIAFVEIIVLWVSILLTIVFVYRVSNASAYLLVPYVLWVSFAAVLNYAIYALN